MIRMKIPLSAPDVSLAEVEAVAEVLRSSRLDASAGLCMSSGSMRGVPELSETLY
jgi:hypothetical protein